MNPGNPFGSQHSGAGSLFVGPQSGASSTSGGQQPGASSAFGGQQSVAGNIFGSSQSAVSSIFGGEQTGTSSTFGGPVHGSSSLFGLPHSGSNSTFGGQQSGASSSFGGSHPGTSNLFGASQSGASSTFGGQQPGADHAFGGQQFGFFPPTSSSSTGAFQTPQPFQFGQPSSFGQSSGSSGQLSSFGQSTTVTGKKPSFGQGASVPGQTSLFGHGAGLTGKTSGFGHGNETSGQMSLFGQTSVSSEQTPLFAQNKRSSVFGQVSESPAPTSTFGQGSVVTRQTADFGHVSGAGGQISSFGQSSGASSKGTSFGQDLPVPAHSILFGTTSGGTGQTTGFRPNVGVLGQESVSVFQTTSSFGQDSGGSGQTLVFSQSSGVNQAASHPISVFGKPSTFGQPPGFTHPSPSGIKPVTPLATATTATSSCSSASDQSFGYKPSMSISTFSVSSNIGKVPGTSGGAPDFTFKPPESATFKPIFGASPEPEKSQAQITPESFTFSQPVSSTPAGMVSMSFTSQSTSASTSTGNTDSLSKPAPSVTLAPAFSFALPTKKCEEETPPSKASKASFASAGSSFVSFSSSSSGLSPSGQAFQTRPSVKLEKEERDSSSELPGGLVKGQKRKEEDYSTSRIERETAEGPEPTSKSDRPPEKRSLLLNRPGNKLFGRVLQDVLKSNEQTGRHWEVKLEKSMPDAREMEQPAASQAPRGLLQSFAAEQGMEQSRTKKGKRRDSADKNVKRILRRRSSSAGSVGELSPSELTAIQIKNIPDHLNKQRIIRKKFTRYGKVERVYCRPEKKAVTIHFQNHGAAKQARQQEQGWLPGIDIFFVKKKTSPGKKQLSPAEKSETIVQESIGRQSAEEQRYQQSPLRKALVRSSVSASSVLTKGSPIKKSGSSKLLPFGADSLDSGSDGQSSDSIVSSLSISLSHLSGTLVETAEERYRILDQRDRILRQARVKHTDLDQAHIFVGTCPDMCPEKERYMRETRNQLSIYEILPGTDKVDHAAAVKEYSRSSADQEEPLPHELRPSPVLCMTMDYLITHIMDQGKDNYREWYDFVWNRTRAIRKDITQQHLCDPATVSLIEKCMRFHIHCAHHLCEEPRSAFEAKINLENTTKCLQSLKEMYQDLANKDTQCSCEAEFRGYSVLLNLNKGDILREVQQFKPEVRNSPEVKFAVQAFAAFNSTNFVRFFRLVKSATYLSGCILHSYFNQIRRDALMAINIAYTSNQRSTAFPVETVTRMLLFRDCDESLDFLTSYGLSVSEGFVELSRLSYSEPEGPIKPKKCMFIEQKRGVSIGEVVNGGPLPHLTPHVPVCSFNSQNKYVGDSLGNEQASSSPRIDVDVIDEGTEGKVLGPDVPLVKVHPQVLPASLPVTKPLLSSVPPLPAGAPTFTPRQVLTRSSMQPEPPSAFTMHPPVAPPSVQQEPPPSSAFGFHQPLVQPTEPQKATNFTFHQPLVRPRMQPETSSVFSALPTPVPAVTSESPKASEFKFQQPHVRPSVQLNTPKASEFTFQTPLIRPEPPSAFSTQVPLVRPVAQPATSATSAFTVPQSVVRPTVHSESHPVAAVSFTTYQPVVPPEEPPKPEFTEQHICEVMEDMVEESLKEHCKVLSENGAAYASTALSVSNTEVNELLTAVTTEFLDSVANEVIMVEKRRLEAEKRRAEEEKRRAEEEKRKAEEEKRRAEEEKRRAEEEKRKAEEARLKQERRHLIEQLSQELCSELAEEVLQESTVQLSSSELNSAFDEDRRQRVARCSQQVSHELSGFFLEEEIFQTAKEALQELQCYCKYLQRWRMVVVARKKLRRQMRAFPAAPCWVDHKDKLKALLPSAVSPPDLDLLTKGILQLGHAGNLGVSYTRLQWLKDQSIHQMKVQYFHQQLLCEAAWTPLDLPSLIAENVPVYCEHVFWKVVLVLPDNEDGQDDGCSRLLSEWVKAKFLRAEESPPPTEDAENKIQTLTTYKAVGESWEQPIRVHVCVKTAVGTLSNEELDQCETRKDLLGTSGFVLLLPPAVSSEDLAEEDVYWLSTLLQLKQLLQAKPFHPAVPLVVLVPTQEEPTMDRQEEVEEGLMLQDLISAKLISEYIIVQIPESITDLRGSSQVCQAVKWLVSRSCSASELCCQTLLQFIEDGVCREFSTPFHHDRAERQRAGLPSQEPSAIVELYNSVLFFLADVVSSENLSELSWPVSEFAERGGNAALPHLQWNNPEHLTWLKKAVLSFQIPQMDLPPKRAPWRPVCSMIFQYVAQIPSSLLTLPILESRVENLLSKTYAKWKRQAVVFAAEEGPSVQDIPWDDLFMLCIDHKLGDWKPPRMTVSSDALSEDGQVGVYFFKNDLDKFVQPVSWKQARMNTLKELEERGFESALLSQRRALGVHTRTSASQSPNQRVTTDTKPQCPREIDLTYVPSREELLPEKLSLSLQAEKEESQRFEDQLHLWLAEDPPADSGISAFPLYIPQTIVSTPESIQTLGRPLLNYQDHTGSMKEETGFLPEPFVSLSERLEKLRNLIQSSKEQDKACDLHLSTLLDVLDN